MAIFGTALGFFVGLSLGLLGGGGSVLTIPIFVYVLAVDMPAAVASSFAVVGVSALVGGIRHARDGNVDFRIVVSFGVLTSVGAFVGARLATAFLSDLVQLLLFATVMLVASVLMYRGRPEPEEDDAAGSAARPWSLIAPVAIAIGLLTGVVGVGGGFMLVPALVLLLRVPVKRAVGTSLLIIPVNATAGFIGYWGRVEIPWGILLPFGGLSILGIFVGAGLMKHVSPGALKKGFAIFLMVVAVYIIIQNAMTLGSA